MKKNTSSTLSVSAHMGLVIESNIAASIERFLEVNKDPDHFLKQLARFSALCGSNGANSVLYTISQLIENLAMPLLRCKEKDEKILFIYDSICSSLGYYVNGQNSIGLLGFVDHIQLANVVTSAYAIWGKEMGGEQFNQEPEVFYYAADALIYLRLLHIATFEIEYMHLGPKD